jgi:hypothetical protein
MNAAFVSAGMVSSGFQKSEFRLVQYVKADVPRGSRVEVFSLAQ